VKKCLLIVVSLHRHTEVFQWAMLCDHDVCVGFGDPYLSSFMLGRLYIYIVSCVKIGTWGSSSPINGYPVGTVIQWIRVHGAAS